MKTSKRRGSVHKNTFTTRSGKTVKVNRSLSAKIKGKKQAKELRKAQRLSGMPKSRLKRFFFRLHPKRLARYWFSREGGIMALKLLGIAFILGFVSLAGLFAYFRKDLPDLRNDISGNNIGGSIQYYDRTGETLLFEDYDAVKRIPVKDDEINQFVKDATIAIEDKDFFNHGGFDVRGIMRAGINNVFGRSSGGQQGGSTITQQLVKLSQDWTKDQTYTRKIKELILAVELERTYSKQEILVGYLNTAPYGGIEYGIEAAARGYFGKPAKDLTLDEAAMFAAIPKSPTYYSPYSNDFDIEAFVGRQHYILDQMVEQGMISSQQRDEAKKVATVAKVQPRKPKYDGIISPWFVMAAKEQLEETRGSDAVLRSGWKVTTTLDMDLQRKAEEHVDKGMAQIRRQGGDTAGFVAEDVKTGQIVALVGGSDFNNPEFGQNNYARLRLPPGSSFKPYDYAALIEHTDNSGAGSVLYDTQGPLEGYPCTNRGRPPHGNCLWNYDFRYPGPVTLRYALGGSRNVPAVKAMLIAGIDQTIQVAEKLGLKSGYKCYSDEALNSETQCYASSSIGDGAFLRLDEHVHAYGSLSRNGLNIPQTYILKIEDVNGKVVDEWQPGKGEQAIREETAYIISDILSDPRASYFSSKAHEYKGHKYSLKTGTTNDTKDGWLMGYSTHYSAGVWVGYHSRQREMTGFMENMTRPIWKGWMDDVHDNLQPEERRRPAGIQTQPAYVIRSSVGGGAAVPSPQQDIYPSWYKNNRRSSNVKRVLDQVSNKLATDCTPPRARQEVDDAAAESFSSDTFVGSGGNNSNTSETDDVHKCDDNKPTVRLSIQQTDGGYNLVAVVTQGTHPLSSDRFKGSVSFSVNGETLPGGSYEINSSGSTVYSNYQPAGTVTVTATVVDSVLYDASDSKTISSSSGLTLSRSGNRFSWNAVAGANSYEFCYGDGSPNNCKTVNSTSVNQNVDGDRGNRRAYVRSNNGVQSPTISW